ncbi:hypothetical protein Zmor_002144 [Zophobas morio]|uniref:Uncharacterized protein n=1 Tax=Zophobas morio TaxID=2755281 RepID=A0AA38MTE3_9CUCU|nr:hypothetical protein Zmor_002144 [Zophobas morio]
MGKLLILFSLLVTSYHLVEAGLVTSEDPESAKTEPDIDVEIRSGVDTRMAGGLHPEAGSEHPYTDKWSRANEEIAKNQRVQGKGILDGVVFRLINKFIRAVKRFFEMLLEPL